MDELLWRPLLDPEPENYGLQRRLQTQSVPENVETLRNILQPVFNLSSPVHRLTDEEPSSQTIPNPPAIAEIMDLNTGTSDVATTAPQQQNVHIEGDTTTEEAATPDAYSQSWDSNFNALDSAYTGDSLSSTAGSGTGSGSGQEVAQMATSLEPSDIQGEDTRNACVEELQVAEHPVPWDHPINSLADTPNLHRQGNEPPTRHIPRVGEVRIPQDVKDWIQDRTHNEVVTTARHTSLLNEMHTQAEEVGVRRTEAEAYSVPGPPTTLFVACVVEKGHVVGRVVNRSKKSAIHSASIMIWAVYGRQLMEAREKSEAETLRSSPPSTPGHFLSEDQSQRVTATRQGELLFQLPIIQHLMVNAEITEDAEHLDPRRDLFFDTEGAHGNILWIFDGLILFVGSTFNHDERDHDFVCNILQHAIAHNTLYGFGLADSNDLQTLARWGVRATRSTIHDLQQDRLSLAASTQLGCKHKVKGVYPHKGIFYASYTAVFNPDMLWNLVGQVVIVPPRAHDESCTCLDWATYIMAEAAAYCLIHARQSLLGAGEIILAWSTRKKKRTAT